MKNSILSTVLIFFYLTTIQAQNSLNNILKSEHEFELGQELLLLETNSAAYSLFNHHSKAQADNLKSLDAKYYEAFLLLSMNNPKGEVLIKNFVTEYPNHPKSVFANYDLGTFYFRTKNYSQAVKYLANVNLIMLNDDLKLENNFKLGYSYMNLKEFDKAGSVFQRIRSTKNKYTFAANYYLGYVNFKNELYDIAETNLKKAFENEGYKNLVPQILANVYYKQKKYDTLIAYGQRSIENLPNIRNIDEINQLIGEGYFQLKDYVNAQKYFEKLKSSKDFNFNHLHSLRYGYCLFQNKNFDAAITELKKIVERYDSTGQTAAYYLGLSYLNQKEKLFAFNTFNQVRKTYFIPTLATEATLLYCNLGLELNKNIETIEAIKEYQKKYPDSKYNEQLNGILGECYLGTNDYISAIKQIESVKNKTGNLNKAYQLITFYLGIEYFNQENYQEAIALFEKSLLNDIDHETTLACHLWYAESQYQLRKYEEAATEYQKALKNPSKLTQEMVQRSYYGLAYSYFNRKEYAKALLFFKDYIDEVRNNNKKEWICDATLRLADCFYATKKYNDAQQTYQKAIEQNCNELDYAYLQRGITLALNNKDEQAKDCFRKISEQYKNSKYYYDALYNLALIDFEKTKYTSSIPVFSRIIEDNNSETFVPLALLKRAIAYNNIKKYESSANDYKTIINDYPKSKAASNALSGLQDALSHLDRTDEVDEIIEKFKSINPKNTEIEKLEFEKVKDNYFNQKFEQTVIKAEKYLSEYTQSSNGFDVKYFLADSYFKTKQVKAAKETYAEVIEEQKTIYLNRSIQKLADIYFEENDLVQASRYYLLLANKAQSKKEEYNAWNGLMQCYYENQKIDSSLIFTDKILTNNSPSIIFTNKALLYKSKILSAKQNENAKDWYIKCFNEAEDQNGAEAMYLYCETLFAEKQYSQSLELLFELTNKFAIYDKWIGKSFLLIADNYIKLDETYQAKATLLSIIEKAKDEALIEIAKEKLSKIDNP